MLVIADTSPIIVLTNIEHTGIFPALFGTVTIPPQVAEELLRPSRSAVVRDFIANKPAWLHVRAPTVIETIPFLHAGEAAAISLAMELKADLLLIDEVLGRNAAARRNIRLTGTIGIIELAARERLLDLKDAFEQVKQTDFWVSHKLLDERLRLHERRNAERNQR
jgi:predicted nucleic acid-binding protein